MASDSKEVASLGRPFTLGMLYDARNDELITGLTLWDEKTLQNITTETPKPFSEFKISAGDSIDTKSSLLDVDASLKASFLGGLIKLGGSAKYLDDKKEFKNQSRVTCQYKATTNFKQLSMTKFQNLNPQQVAAVQRATHIVTGILYGAHAFFVFDSEKLEDSSVKTYQGSMEAVIKKIPTLNVKGKVEIKLSKEEKAMTEKFSCKFYGDFILDSNPATFEDAVKTYVELPKLLGEKGEKSVPLKVWLTPLKTVDSRAAELKKEISTDLLRKVLDTVEDLREIEMRCNDALTSSVVEKFPQVKKELDRFKNSCNDYASNLQKAIAKSFPLIRGGKEREDSVKQLFEDQRNKSPFSHEKLSKWLDCKERKINVIRSCVEMMEGTKIVQSQSELDKEVLAPGVENSLCFVFTSLENADPYLDAMADYFGSRQGGSSREDPWYYSDDVLTKMREKAKAYQDLANKGKKNRKFCFVIGAIGNKKYKGATIYHYKDCKLVTEDYTKPDLPPV